MGRQTLASTPGDTYHTYDMYPLCQHWLPVGSSSVAVSTAFGEQSTILQRLHCVQAKLDAQQAAE